MTNTTTASHPEPEEPMTWDEQVAQYRNDYRNTMTRVATVMTMPVNKARAVFVAATEK